MRREPPLPQELWDRVAPDIQAAIRVLVDEYERHIAALEGSRMKQGLGDHVVFVPKFHAVDKMDALQKIAHALLEGKEFTYDEVERLANVLMEREQLGTTALGEGSAIPHGKFAGITGIYAGWFYANPPIDFAASDGAPVSIILCLVAPESSKGPHLKLLAQCSHILKDKDFRKSMVETPPETVEEWRARILQAAERL